jgi:SAM-dependent methyltransferase
MRLFTEVPGPITADQPVILDFGCGCGRMLRFMNNLSGVWSVHGCDVNLHHVRWCQSNLNSIQTAQCSPQPPLPYDDEVFNLVYALSVFSHLSEFNAALWLEELRRVLRPGGVAILTTHGVPALEIIRDSEAHQHMFGLDRQSIIEILSQFKERSFVFQRYSNDVLRNANAGEEYGNTFIHPDYLFQKWDAAGLRVLRHIPGGVRGWQDIVVLQKHASK